jgi:outer membrane protein
MKNSILHFFILFLFTTQVLAQAGAIPSGKATNTFTLEQALKLAESNNLQVKQSQIQVQNANLSLQQAKNNLLPSANGYSNLSTNFGRGIDFITNTYTNRTITNNNMGLNGDLVLYQGGALQNTIKQNSLDVKASELDLQALKDNISLQVILAYLNVLNLEDQLLIAHNQAGQRLCKHKQCKRAVKQCQAKF